MLNKVILLTLPTNTEMFIACNCITNYAEERRILIAQAGAERLTLSFYQYHQILNPQIFRDYLFLYWNKIEVLGRIYVAHEGINAQLLFLRPASGNLKDF